MNRIHCFVLLFTGMSAVASAQTPNVSGIVIDDRTEEPIRGVLVYVEEPIERHRN